MTTLYNILFFCLGFGTCFILLFVLSLRFRGGEKAEELRDRIDRLSKENQNKQGL